jgi:hypothetical protein
MAGNPWLNPDGDEGGGRAGRVARWLLALPVGLVLLAILLAPPALTVGLLRRAWRTGSWAAWSEAAVLVAVYGLIGWSAWRRRKA